MSEPPEPEEEEPAADADLEELLEQFREPEEVPRPRANPLWLISAILLSVLACWLALRAGGGGTDEQPESAALAGEMLPGKVSQRTARAEDEKPVDVVEDYLARCKKGMTAQEVRWIVEDFQRAGLGEGQGSVLTNTGRLVNDPSRVTEGKINTELAVQLRTASLECARNQREWYGNALADGLRLDAAQKKALKERLNAALAVDREQFENRVKAFALFVEGTASDGSGLTPEITEKIGRLSGGEQVSHGFFEGTTYLRFLETTSWLADERYAPWVVCDLSPEQEAVTRRSEFEEEMHLHEEASAHQDLYDAPTWLVRGTPFRTSLTDKREIHIADGEFGELAAAGQIFPLEEAQLFEGEKFLRINDPTRLHPAQLKMLLLLEPERAAEILQALEKAGE